jgi:hypothetical protein
LDIVWGFEKNSNLSSSGSFFISTSFIKMSNELFSFLDDYSIFFLVIIIKFLEMMEKRRKPNNIKDIRQEETFIRL